MKKIAVLLSLSLFFFLALLDSANCQTKSADVFFEADELNQKVVTIPNNGNWFKSSGKKKVPLVKDGPFIAYSVVWESEEWNDNSFLDLYFFDGEKHSGFRHIKLDPHAIQEGNKHISELYFIENDITDFTVTYTSNSAQVENIKVHFFSPGETKEEPTLIAPISTRAACPCPQPSFLDRLGWCPDGDCPEITNPAFTEVTHLIVHHSAGSNSSSDWAATVRAIWDFHVNVNGWDDIGYNWLVDPNGVLYQGRGDNVRGAHFCGNNSGTMGVCVMGDFTSITPTPDAYSSLEKLLSWKACDIGANPIDTGFHSSSNLDLLHISGHRDGCSTACPGDAFYPSFDAIRAGVVEYIETGCNDVFIEAPTALTADRSGVFTIELDWLDNADNETGYTVERSLNFDNSFSEIASLPANTTSYTDMDFDVGTAYHYRVVADSAEYFSLYSNDVYVPAEVVGVEDYGLIDGSVQIYPNPTTQNAILIVDNQWIGEIKIAISDALGRQMSNGISFQKINKKHQIELDLKSISVGVYWVKIEQGNGASGTFRIVKK